MTLRNKIKYFFEDLEYLNTYTSPFKPINPKWYFGKVAIGTPYFLPRKWVKATPRLINKAVLDYIKREERYNKLNPSSARIIKPYDEVYQEKSTYSFPVPKKIGFDFVRLGWKSKWRDTDYRFEWNPGISFVFFKWQINVTFMPKNDYHYWECWLYYTRNTDKTKTVRERLIQARKEFERKFTRYTNGEKINYDGWDLILKDKWL